MRKLILSIAVLIFVSNLILFLTSCEKVSTFPRDKDDDQNMPGNKPPNTAITSGPNNVTITDTVVTFTWTGTDDKDSPGQLVYSYKFDNAQWTIFSPTVQKTFPNLGDGNHVFMVKSRDSEGAIDPTPAVAQFTVSSNGSSSAPDTDIISGPPTNSSSSTAIFLWTGYDEQDPPHALRFSYKMDNDVWSVFDHVTTKQYMGLINGSHLFQVKAKNTSGLEDPTPAVWSFNVNTNTKGVKLSAVSTTILANPKDWTAFDCTITNIGSNTDDFRVSLDTSGVPPEFNATLCKGGTCYVDNKIDFNLGPSASDTFEPHCDVFATAASGDTATLRIFAQSLTDPSVTDSLILTVRVR